MTINDYTQIPLYNGADAAFPGQALPAGTKILCAYVGALDLAGQPDTPHIWTRDEWNLYLDPDSVLYGGPDLRVMPIYVHDYPGDAAADARNATDAAIDLGWEHDKTRILWWDSETLIDPAYTAELDQIVYEFGFLLGKYGVTHTVLQDPPVKGGAWVAQLQASRPRLLPPYAVGQQWQFGTHFDRDVFSQFVYDHAGQGLRRVVA